eukprot:9612288-Alexandrium_andersonii.AAC.1
MLARSPTAAEDLVNNMAGWIEHCDERDLQTGFRASTAARLRSEANPKFRAACGCPGAGWGCVCDHFQTAELGGVEESRA